ncbi:glycosyl transferase family 90-domain-containing protein [Mycena epipterygia]|nr:glycosyl transferase family 90-domain-containing protein [Mycena epipterygia]
MNPPDIPVECLGACRNKSCDSGCGQFYGNFVPGVPRALTRCDDHGTAPAPAPAEIPPPTPAFAPPIPGPSAFSATASTLSGSRATPATTNPLNRSTAAKHHFRSLAQLRQKGAAAAMSAANADLNPLAAGSKKRKKKGSQSATDRNVRPKSTAVKKLPCVLVLMANTKEVSRGKCKVPPPQILIGMDEAGYVKDVSFSSDATPDDVQDQILSAFNHIPAVKEFGLRLLRTRQQIHRNKRAVKTYVPSALNIPDLTSFSALTDSNVRSAGPRFKRIVFISLQPGGPNLPMGDEDESDADFPSDAMSEDSAKSDDLFKQSSVYFFQVVPRLKRLDFDGAGDISLRGAPGWRSTPGHDPDAPLAFNLRVPPIVSAISTLIFEIFEEFSPDDARRPLESFIASLTLPCLTSLFLSAIDHPRISLPWPHSQFLSLSERSSFHAHLTKLYLYEVIITESELLQSLAALPALEWLTISDQLAVLPDGTEHLLITDTLLVALTKTPQSPCLIPRLRIFACQSMLKFDDNIYLKFSLSRLQGEADQAKFIRMVLVCQSRRVAPQRARVCVQPTGRVLATFCKKCLYLNFGPLENNIHKRSIPKNRPGADCSKSLSDILFPTEYYYDRSWWSRKFAHRDNIPWENKAPKIYWRGMSNGGMIIGENYHHFARFKLADMAREHPDLMDVTITRFGETLCEEGCDRMAVLAEYNITGNSEPREDIYFGLLRSGSLVFKSTLFEEYFNDWLRPFEHYVPVKADLSDLVRQINWANEHPDEARVIQQRGMEVARRVLTDDQNDCHFSAVLLEWALLQGYARDFRDIVFVNGPFLMQENSMILDRKGIESKAYAVKIPVYWGKSWFKGTQGEYK